MVGLSAPDEMDGEVEPGGVSGGDRGGSASPESDQIEVGPVLDPEPEANAGRVEFGSREDAMELDLSEAVELAGEMLTNPEAFDIARLEPVEELEEENEQLRERLDAHEQAVAELAEAVEVLSERQADIGGWNIPASVRLSPSAMGDLYTPSGVGGE